MQKQWLLCLVSPAPIHGLRLTSSGTLYLRMKIRQTRVDGRTSINPLLRLLGTFWVYLNAGRVPYAVNMLRHPLLTGLLGEGKTAGNDSSGLRTARRGIRFPE